MSKIKLLIIIYIICGSCSSIQPKEHDIQYYNEFYTIINDLIRYRFFNVSVIRSETKPVNREVKYDTQFTNDSTIPLPPPPPGLIYYDSNWFKVLFDRRHLSFSDKEYMYKSIDSTKTIIIDSSKIDLRLASKEQFEKIFEQDDMYEAYQSIKKAYGTNNFIIVSTPVFNSSYSKAIISIDYHCGPLCGQGYKFVLEKKNGKWKIIDEFYTWES